MFGQLSVYFPLETCFKCCKIRRAFYLIIKVPIKAQDIGVSKMTLYFNFPAKLMLNLRLLQLALEEHF